MTKKPGTFKFSYLGLDPASIKHSLGHRLLYNIGKNLGAATNRDLFQSTAYVVRDRLIERWIETMRSYEHSGSKRVYYLSLEYLLGRALQNSLINMDINEECRQALYDLGVTLEAVEEMEPDAALGNGGLGRLAACFLDSMASLRLPGFGYGIRYEYGMFNQRIEAGRQVEHPENWLRYGNPWEFPRPETLYPIKFYGRVVETRDETGRLQNDWCDSEEIMAMAYDVLIPGFGTNTVNHLRLWSAKASRDFNLTYFNEGNYIKAVSEKNQSENLSRVLYPNDSTEMGRELRLQQEYFFVSAALQDILFQHMSLHRDLSTLADKIAIQLNDTHPAIAIPELMRLLMDCHQMDWEPAWDITVRTFSYTNHTLMPEALETWPVSLFGQMLPRHLQIIYEINRRFLDDVRHRFPGDRDLVRRLSLIDETGERSVRMAHLATVGSHKVNGVSRIHTDLMKRSIFADLDRMFPGRIINVTNGITPRRWLQQINPQLSELISEHIGGGWNVRLERLQDLRPLADDAQFRDRFRAAKQANKDLLARLIGERLKITVDSHSLFDVQAKRIHEYKRQLLNLLHVITLYRRARSHDPQDEVPRTVIFSGKAAPGYRLAKLIVRLINDVADVINRDPAVGGLLKVVFIPNYDVTTAGDIIPAADLSEQISMAGTEASGTGNMKLALNGALTIGTLDGANIEIMEEVGEDNIFIFGLRAREARQLKADGYQPREYLEANGQLAAAIAMIADGFFCPDEPDRYRDIVDSLTEHDPFLVLADYAAYVACQERVADLYRDPDQWARRAILNVAGVGLFSSDRAVSEYAEQIWGVAPVAHA